jgi:hypothetical protein
MKGASAQQTLVLNKIDPTVENRINIALAPLVWAENWFSAVAHSWLTKQGAQKNRTFLINHINNTVGNRVKSKVGLYPWPLWSGQKTGFRRLLIGG